MSLIHYLYLGHFEYDGGFVRFSKNPNDSDSVYHPVIRSPIDQMAIEIVLREVLGVEVEAPAFPEDWSIWLAEGFLICNKSTGNREEIDFITRLVERTRCDIHDRGSFCDITLAEWLDATRCHAKL